MPPILAGLPENTGRGAERVRRTRGSHGRPETAVLRGGLHTARGTQNSRVPTIPRTGLSGSLHLHCVYQVPGLVLNPCFPPGGWEHGSSQAKPAPGLQGASMEDGSHPVTVCGQKSGVCPVEGMPWERALEALPCLLWTLLHVPFVFADLALRPLTAVSHSPEDHHILSPVSPPSKAVTLGAVLGTVTGIYNESKPNCL